MVRIGEQSLSLDDIMSRTTEFDILNYYFNINNIPQVISSPFRKDNNPSFGIYTTDGIKVKYTDFATKEHGGIIDMLMKYWGVSYSSALKRIWEDLPNFSNSSTYKKSSIGNTPVHITSNSELEVKIREWEKHDTEYWESYGVTLEWLKHADVYPVSHKVLIKDGKRYTFKAEKYAYVYVEKKEGRVTLKLYQPYSKRFKWLSKHDKSVISLWTKIPEYGDKVCICSSLKDALCLSCQTGIPALAIQGEGYNMSNTAISELKRRYNKVFICLDNDEPGIKDARKLSEETGFTNVVLPNINNSKDISDLFKSLKDPLKFKGIMLDLFKEKESIQDNYNKNIN